MSTQRFSWCAVFLPAVLWAAPASAAYRLDQKEYSLEEPVYLLALGGDFRCGQETVARLQCSECRGGAAACPCLEKPAKVSCRLQSKMGATEVWELAQQLKAGHYRLRIQDRPESLEFYVRSWPGLPPLELELETDAQIYRAGEEIVVSLRNGSDHPVMVLEGCFKTPIRFYESPVGESGRRPHACLSDLPQPPGVAAVVDPHRKLAVHLRVPDAANIQLTPYVELQRASTLWEYSEKFGTLREKGFRDEAEAQPVCVLPAS
ncbi:MAG: hypothetical protein NTY77_07390 [Elusimicrobia bacterium]|nr:hypothetical protein [Elusimicrobiota bacterium]